jgi:hypothetical protein
VRSLLVLGMALAAGLASVGDSDAAARLAPLPADVGGEGGWTALVTDDAGRPATFDPCKPVRWVLRPDGAPIGGDRVVHQSVAQLARGTGLRFVFSGVTDEPPSSDRPQQLPERYGPGPAPVLVAWSTPQETPALAGSQVGLGVTLWAQDRARLVSGQVVLDAAAHTDLDGAVTPLAASTVRHELAHVVGLGHVEDEASSMHPVVVTRAGFSAGDLRGLRAAGSGPCS